MRVGLPLLVASATVALLGGAASAQPGRQGGTFRIAVPAVGITGLPRFATIDPALSAGIAAAIVLRPACATLLAYPDVPLPAGLHLVPDLAVAFPKISADGKTYTFTVRKGLRFSDGQPVTAASFAHAIHRFLDPKMESSDPSLFADVVGAQAVLDGKAASPSGITARGNRLVIRLTKPNGDLSWRMSGICAVPPNLPSNPEGAAAPLPSPAPYYVAQYVPKQLVVLERNRFYRGSRPHRVDRFVVTLDHDESTILEQVEHGQADWAAAPSNVGGFNGAQLANKYGINKSRFFIEPGFNLWTFILNTSRPLFKNNVPLRRAVNFAIDRAALANARGPYWGHLIDHYLSPLVPGSEHVHVYPLARPDLAKARALARGHTRGGHATLYACETTICATAAQILRDNLKPIGLDVEIRQFPSPLVFRKMATPGEEWDIGWIGWISNTPVDPGFWLSNLFDGRRIGTSNNYSYFNSQRFNRLFDDGAKLRHSRTRDRFYGRFDVELARDAAPMAAYAIENDFTFVSARTGCVVVNPAIDLTAVCLK